MNRLIWSRLDEAARSAALTRPVQTVAQQTRDAVATLIAQVRAQGDDALRAITARFDGVELRSFEVSEAEFAAADAAVPAELRQAMVEAAERIARFHAAGMGTGYAVETAPGVVCERM
ncbi:TPA: histidinol dehydrogenase, partial [Stenotrophomonas maltophilia]